MQQSRGRGGNQHVEVPLGSLFGPPTPQKAGADSNARKNSLKSRLRKERL